MEIKWLIKYIFFIVDSIIDDSHCPPPFNPFLPIKWLIKINTWRNQDLSKPMLLITDIYNIIHFWFGPGAWFLWEMDFELN